MASESLQTDELEERIQQRVGARVRELRQAAGITAVVLAERTGISQGQLSKIENGKAALVGESSGTPVPGFRPARWLSVSELRRNAPGAGHFDNGERTRKCRHPVVCRGGAPPHRRRPGADSPAPVPDRFGRRPGRPAQGRAHRRVCGRAFLLQQVRSRLRCICPAVCLWLRIPPRGLSRQPFFP
jgi:hypothetical protein